ncbi:hypothetical protein D9M69_654870 [compost metagenome]
MVPGARLLSSRRSMLSVLDAGPSVAVRSQAVSDNRDTDAAAMSAQRRVGGVKWVMGKSSR